MSRLFAFALAALLGAASASAQTPPSRTSASPARTWSGCPPLHPDREDARHGQGDLQGLRDRPRLGRRAQCDRCRETGARALGVEYEAQLVSIARQNAQAAGVADKAKFVQGDMFEADISQATVFALFLLPDNLRLKPKFEKLKPGTRIVTNGFEIDGWEAKEIARIDKDCGGWCTAYLYILRRRLRTNLEHRVAGLLALQHAHHFLRSAPLTARLRLARRAADVRCEQHVVELEQGMILGRRLGFEHVDRGASLCGALSPQK